MPATQEEIIAGLAEIIEEVTGIEPSEVTPEKSFVDDLDIDSLDRVFAPATPGSRPGGLTPYELRRVAWLCGAHPKVRAIDLVEVDPTQDVADVTVMATASCLLSFASGLLARN